MTQKNIILLGATGSIGTSTLNLIRRIEKIKEPRSIQIYDQQDTITAKKKGKWIRRTAIKI